ncbi:MGMT family protein [Candidatus Pacearchaeota archaeon]|nr:MGMT family protein [Candidatus Pacearchaeota archaeon]
MNFNEKCYEILKKVPRGKVTTYGELARAVGSPKAARAVGNAMKRNPYGFLSTGNSSKARLRSRNKKEFPVNKNPYGFLSTGNSSKARLRSRNKKEFPVNKNPYAPEVPCHRVVGAKGEMVGFASGVDKKIKMLKEECVEVENGRVDLGKYFYGLK